MIAGAGDLLDFYVIHDYGFDGEPDAGAALAIPEQTWPDLMQRATETLAGENPSRAVPIAITEYNMVAFQDSDNDRLMASALNLLYVADTLGQMAEHGVTIANQWNLANGKAANGTDYGMLDADTGSRNPQYYALALWARFGDELLATDVGFSAETELSAYAGRATDGTISVLAINKTADADDRASSDRWRSRHLHARVPTLSAPPRSRPRPSRTTAPTTRRPTSPNPRPPTSGRSAPSSITRTRRTRSRSCA